MSADDLAKTLRHFVTNNDVAQVSQLLDLSLNPNHSSDELTSRLMVFGRRCKRVVNAPMQFNVNLNIPPAGPILLQIACNHGYTEMIKVLLEHGSLIDDSGNWGITELHSACYKGDIDIVKILLEHGASFNISCVSGKTSLHYACEAGNTDIVKILLEHGSSCDVSSVSGKTPLHYACNIGHIELIKILLEHGSSVNTFDIQGMIPLHRACSMDQIEIIKILLEHGSSVNISNMCGVLPLHTACLMGHCDVIKILLLNGADLRLNEPKYKELLLEHCATKPIKLRVEEVINKFLELQLHSVPKSLEMIVQNSIRNRLIEHSEQGVCFKEKVAKLPLTKHLKTSMVTPVISFDNVVI